MKFHWSHIAFMALLIGAFSCSADTSKSATAKSPTRAIEIPQFSADSAFHYIEKQLAFGARVPGTEAHAQTAQWLAAELRRHGAAVTVQQGTVTAYNGTRLPIYNVVGSYRPELSHRILLLAHWDSRHIADHDPDSQKRHKPVPGANDGASGVGVLLELARLAGEKAPSIGIDIMMVDAEDYGAPEDWQGARSENTWALGTQFWCRRPHIAGYRASYGILLDMVGAEDAKFHKEYFSKYYAGGFVDMIWETAARLGHGRYFLPSEGGAITDDHYFINRMAGIPTLDIIHTEIEGEGTFFPYWHTTEDTLDKIARPTLQAVGETLVHTLWR